MCEFTLVWGFRFEGVTNLLGSSGLRLRAEGVGV